MKIGRMLVVLSLFTGSLVSSAESKRPNVVIIMSDDMGFSDLGCYGGIDQTTPNLDRLASRGVRFTQFYNTARCCPTRAALLTGLYPHQAGVGHMMDDRGVDGYRGNLNRQCVTIAEVLKPAGYRRYMTGKWHVTKDVGENSDKANWPLQRGFEKYYGTLVGAGNFFDPAGLCRQNTLITRKTDPDYQPQDFYYTDAISDNAIQFLQQHRKETPDQPFFLYVAYTAAHWPMQAPEKDIAKHRGKFDQGYSPHRAARLQRMKELGLVSTDTVLSEGAEDWSRIENPAWEARCMEVYSAMIEKMDTGIGRIVDDLRASNQLDNTLVLFLQDNGACAETVGRNAGDRGRETFDGRPVRTGPAAMPGPGDTYIAYGRGWANVSNTPFREYKHWVHEGGISTPLIAHWPRGIPNERAGQIESQPAHLIDLMSTCVDISGADYPAEFRDQKIKPREGVSLLPAFQGRSLNRREPLFWEHEGNKAIRDGRWKLVAKANQPWELYDLEADRIESHNLAAGHPELVKKLSEQWDACAVRMNVVPTRLEKTAAALPAGKAGQTRFELKPGSSLEKDQAPSIARRGLAITADIATEKPGSSGVILSQGGSRLGYVLYLDQGMPVFAVRSGSQVHEIRGNGLLAGKHMLKARLSSSGELSLQIDGVSAGKPTAGKVLTGQPAEGLLVGRDEGGAVGSYRVPHPFSDTIDSVVLELEPITEGE